MPCRKILHSPTPRLPHIPPDLSRGSPHPRCKFMSADLFYYSQTPLNSHFILMSTFLANRLFGRIPSRPPRILRLKVPLLGAAMFCRCFRAWKWVGKVCFKTLSWSITLSPSEGSTKFHNIGFDVSMLRNSKYALIRLKCDDINNFSKYPQNWLISWCFRAWKWVGKCVLGTLSWSITLSPSEGGTNERKKQFLSHFKASVKN